MLPEKNIGEVSRIENIPLHPELKAMAEKILAQNEQILAMNARLLEMLSFPRSLMVVNVKNDNK